MSKKASFHKILMFIGFLFAIILLIFLIKHKWDISAAVNAILSFGK